MINVNAEFLQEKVLDATAAELVYKSEKISNYDHKKPVTLDLLWCVQLSDGHVRKMVN